MTSQKDLKYISELIAKSTGEYEIQDFQLLEVPKMLVVSREYRAITKATDGKDFVVKFTVYENYPYMTLSGIQAN